MPGFLVLHHLAEPAQTHVHWVGDAIQPSRPLIIPFSSCPQSFPASGSFLISQLFASGGQSIRASASASVLPVNFQDWFPLGLTGFDLLTVQKTLKSFIQHRSSKASILWQSAFLTSLLAQTVKHLSTMWETRVRSLGWEVPWRRKWQSSPVLLPGKSHEQRSLVGYSPWGHKESDTTEQFSLHFLHSPTFTTIHDYWKNHSLD